MIDSQVSLQSVSLVDHDTHHVTIILTFLFQSTVNDVSGRFLKNICEKYI
jgi:hypothetical protein